MKLTFHDCVAHWGTGRSGGGGGGGKSVAAVTVAHDVAGVAAF